MQSTGHSSMHARSSTSTQGRAMMYVTYELLFHTAGGGAGQAAPNPSIADHAGVAKLAWLPSTCRLLRKHRRLSAKRDPGAGRRAASSSRRRGPALPAVRGSPPIALAGHLLDPELAGVGHQPRRHRPVDSRRSGAHLDGRIAEMPDRQPAERPAQPGFSGGQPRPAADLAAVPAPHRVRQPSAEAVRHRGALRLVQAVGAAIRAVLYGLRRLIDAQVLVVRHRGERGKELGAGVDRVEQLAPGTPALRWPLLEDAYRVSVAVAEVLQIRLLQRGGIGDGNGAL